MKTKFLLLPIFSMFLILISCHEDQVSVAGDICHTWGAKTFISLESVVCPKNGDNAILLIIRKDGTYNFNKN